MSQVNPKNFRLETFRLFVKLNKQAFKLVDVNQLQAGKSI